MRGRCCCGLWMKWNYRGRRLRSSNGFWRGRPNDHRAADSDGGGMGSSRKLAGGDARGNRVGDARGDGEEDIAVVVVRAVDRGGAAVCRAGGGSAGADERLGL